MRYILYKKIDRLLFSRFILTFVSVFSIILFVLITQQFFFICRYIIGKGLGVYIYAKIIFYLALLVTPDTVPITILFTSILVFTNLSENRELTAMHAAGISVYRILRIPCLLVIYISIAIFYFQSYSYPTILPRISNLITDVFQKKSSLFLQEGIFCNNIPGYNILVKKKLDNHGNMEGIKIYDYTRQYGKIHITTAQNGRLYTTQDGLFLIMELYAGHNYIKPHASTKVPLIKTDSEDLFYRMCFDSQKISINLNALRFNNGMQHNMNSTESKTYPQLIQRIASLREQLQQTRQQQREILQTDHDNLLIPPPVFVPNRKEEAIPEQNGVSHPEMKGNFGLFLDKLRSLSHSKNHNTYCNISQQEEQVIQDAIQAINRTKRRLQENRQRVSQLTKQYNKARFEQHRRLSSSIQCIIAFLLTAPLGCLLRQHRFPKAIMVTLIFITVQYIATALGKEYAISDYIPTLLGAWLSNLILLPLCLFFLKKASKGTVLSLSHRLYLFKTYFIPHRKKRANPFQ